VVSGFEDVEFEMFDLVADPLDGWTTAYLPDISDESLEAPCSSMGVAGGTWSKPIVLTYDEPRLINAIRSWANYDNVMCTWDIEVAVLINGSYEVVWSALTADNVWDTITLPGRYITDTVRIRYKLNATGPDIIDVFEIQAQSLIL
jgi:hypothetical protein